MALFSAMLASLTALSTGHRPMVNGVSCGTQFATADTAITVHDITVEWAMNRVVTCDGQMLWVTFDVPEDVVGRRFYISAGSLHASNGNERASRFDALRVEAALLGPGLPALDRTGLPAHAVIPDTFETGNVFRSPEDQSTCAHSEWLGAMDPPHCEVEGGVCSFFETYGRTWQTVTLDVTPEVVAAGTHHMAAWLASGETGKFWFAVGLVGGSEDFVTQFEIPTGRCPCGVDPSAFMEAGSMAAIGVSTATFYERAGQDGEMPDDAPPEVMQCSPSSQTPPELADYCGVGAMPVGRPDEASRPSAQADNTMEMGCGDIDGCASSARYVAAGIDMHGNMAIPFTGDVALDFVRGMIPHHQGAVDMCAILLSAGDTTEAGLVHFCNHVQQEQSIELAVMQRWLGQFRSDAVAVDRCEDMSSMGCGDLSGDAAGAWVAANHRMHQSMGIRFVCDAQVDFVRGMIPHHQGAIEMCEILAMYAEEDAMLWELCDNVTRVQRSEIMWMNNWLVARPAERMSSCTEGAVADTMPCEDLFVVSDSCHHFNGGDLRCLCSDLIDTYPCGTIAELTGGPTIDVSAVCMRTCGDCSERAASPVGSGGGMDHSNMDHSNMDHSNMNHGNDTESRAVGMASVSMAASLSTVAAALLTLGTA